MMEAFFLQYSWMIPLAPLVGFLMNGLGVFLGLPYAKSKKFSGFIACLAIFVAFVFALGVFWNLMGLPPEERSVTRHLYTWLSIGNLKADAAFLLDPLSAVMMLVITGVGFLIHVYSTGYMQDDPSFPRFFTYLNLFCFAMLLLVMGNNLFMLFIGWEGVGLCSYLLIGFWFTHKPNAVAGMKAFVVNRIGDFAFMLGVFLLFWSLYSQGHGTVTFKEIGTHVHVLGEMKFLGLPVAVVVGILLFIGATGKSAQIPLYVWLPDAMAGPTPVSALIHAATMVTAGVYMIGRLNFVYTMAPEALIVVATVGALTAIFAASIGFAQNDIKKVLAYSTVSQLGYMFLGMGTGAYSAGIFHLMTHAFFKACLFLGSGSVILGMHHEQDMRRMGGLKKYMPVTYWTFLLATVAIAGIFPFAGFFSKDEILWKAFESGGHQPWFYVLWGLGLLGAMGTAFYMFRAVAMTFYGKLGARSHEIPVIDEVEHALHHDDDEEPRDAADLQAEHNHHAHAHEPHESPSSMLFALVVLAVLSVLGGLVGIPYALGHFFHLPNFFEAWLEPVFASAHAEALVSHEVHAIEYFLMALSVTLAALSIFIAVNLYTRRQAIPKRFAERFPRLYRTVLNKYYVDEIYQALVVNNLLRLNNFLAAFDNIVIDGFVNFLGTATRITSKVTGFFDNAYIDGLVNGLSRSVIAAGGQLRKLQTGRIQNYLYVAMAGVLVLMLWKLI
ncbi:MAG TPA: NADH-quinone oxidoreductase subunit L [Deltaproteobacteria bacterium]|nr:NADH-quinone oxidoreductase subunit L [Deltaproteobacteria bacterium]